MREILSMIVVLSVFCGASGWILASLKQYTAPLIEEQELFHVKGPALRHAFGSFDNDPIKERRRVALPDGGSLLVFPAQKDGKLAAVAFERFGDGYGGPLGVMVGFDLSRDALTGIGITTHRETPGVGSRVTSEGFLVQFAGHPFAKLGLKAAGGDIDAVSGATASSTAAGKAVAQALELWGAARPEIEKAFAGGAS